jgi:hypothetical protein
LYNPVTHTVGVHVLAVHRVPRGGWLAPEYVTAYRTCAKSIGSYIHPFYKTGFPEDMVTNGLNRYVPLIDVGVLADGTRCLIRWEVLYRFERL